MGSSSSFRVLLITDGFDDDTPNRVAAALRELPGAAVQLRAKRLDASTTALSSRLLSAVRGDSF